MICTKVKEIFTLFIPCVLIGTLSFILYFAKTDLDVIIRQKSQEREHSYLFNPIRGEGESDLAP